MIARVFRLAMQGFSDAPSDLTLTAYWQNLRRHKPIYILHLAFWLALAGYTAFVLVSSGRFLHSWALLWLAGLVGLSAAPVFPSLGPLIYLVVTYSVPRYTPPYYLINDLALPETIAYFAMVALIVQRITKKERIDFGGLAGWLLAGLWLALCLSAVYAILRGSPWDPAGIAPMGRLNQIVIMFLLGVNALAIRRGLLALSITLLLTVLVRVAGGGLESARGDHDLAYLIAVAFPFVLGLSLVNSVQLSVRLVTVVSALSLLAVLAFTRNRGAVIGLACGMLVLWLRSPRRLFLACSAVIAIAGGYLFLPWESFTRGFASIGIDQSSEGRINVWRAAINMIGSNPILGVGLGNFQEKSLQYGENPVMGALVAHNNFLHVAGEGGLFALAAYAGLIAATFLAAMRLCRSSTPWLRIGGRIVESSMIGYVVAGLFLSRHNFALAYLVMGLASGLSQLTKQQAPD